MANDWYAAIQAEALRRAPAILSQWMPAGRISGSQFEAPDPHEQGSIKIRIGTGQWKNFSSGSPGGSNLIGLFAHIKGIEYNEAARELAETLHIERPAPLASSVWEPIVPIPDFAPVDENGLPPIPTYNRGDTDEIKGMWCYLNREGQPIAWRVRIDSAKGDKTLLPLTFCRNAHDGATAWRWKDLPAPRPLYGLEWLALEPVTRVLIVEGEKTADAARRLLADAWCVVTWPGGVQRISTKHTDWSPILNLPSAARIVLWPDADDPGIKAMAQLADVLKGRCQIVQPAPDWRKGWDLADAEAEGWTTERVLQFLEANIFAPPKAGDREAIQASASQSIAQAYMRAVGPSIRRWDGSWWNWTGMHSLRRSEEDERAQVARFIVASVTLQSGKEGTKELSRSLLDNVMDALRSHLNLPSSIKPPCWLDGEPPFEARAIATVENGLVELSTGKLHPPSPHWFCLSALQAEYDPDATCLAWESFLEEIWEDQQSRETLQEIFGYLLAADTSQQKAFLIIGPPRSGKGTIGRVLAALLGPDAVTRPALADFGTPFGLEPLIGKSLAIISDARLDQNVPAGVLAERLLAISGEDTINIARKYKDSWNGPLSVRFLLLTNELPLFSDASGALPNRFVLLRMTRTWLGQEDPTLFRRFAQELSGILNWAMVGWMRLQERGHFVQPTASMEIASQLSNIASRVATFIEDGCILDSEQDISIGDLHRHYVKWCKETETKPLPVTLFGRDLRASNARLNFYKPMGQPRRVKGVGIKYWDESSGLGGKNDEQF